MGILSAIGKRAGRFYHGTTADIRGALAASDASNPLGPGLYVSRDPAYASRWAMGSRGAEGANVMPLEMDGRIASAAEWRAALLEARALDPARGETIAQDILKRAGFAGAESGNDVVIFDPLQVRSPFGGL